MPQDSSVIGPRPSGPPWIANAAIASSISPIGFVDRKGRITYVNLAFLATWGYESSDDVIGEMADRFWSTSQMQGGNVRRLRDKGGWIGEIAARHRDGHTFPVQVSATMLADETGEPACQMVSFIDISQRVAARDEQLRLLDELRERIKELDCLYKILSIPHLSDTPLDGVLQQIVAAISQSLQHPVYAWARIVAGELDISTSNYRATGKSLRTELVLGDEEGYVEIGYVCDAGGKGADSFLEEERALLAAAAHEISRLIRQKRTENELRINREQLVHADKMASIGVVSAEILHETGNPNNYIALNARMLTQAWESIVPVLDAYYRENGNFAVAGIPYSDARTEIPSLARGILDGSNRIREICSRLNPLVNNGEPLQHATICINESIRRAVEFTRDLLTASTTRFELELDGNHPVIHGNEHQIQQIIVNLLTNACQALTDPGQRIRVTSRFDTVGGKVVVMVQDQGAGIDSYVLKHCTEPFFSTRKARGNTGLGLSISSDIARRHGAELTIDSRPGTGTCASLLFPACPGEHP